MSSLLSAFEIWEESKLFYKIDRDVLICISGAILCAPVEFTAIRRFQLMQRVNPKGFCH
jgi:hypothetical protein